MKAPVLEYGNQLGCLQAGEQSEFVLNTRQGPSPNDWERLKSTIKQLYIGEGRLLRDVIPTMARLHSHKAS
jgi:hypothetical protein